MNISLRTIIKHNMNRLLMNKAEYDSWVHDTASYAREFLMSNKYTYGALDGVTYVVNLDNNHTATARCRECDDFDADIGLALAFTRYMNKPTPLVYEIVKLIDLKIGDTVVRQSGAVVKFCGLEQYDDTVVLSFSNTLNGNTINPITLTGSPDDRIYRIVK